MVEFYSLLPLVRPSVFNQETLIVPGFVHELKEMNLKFLGVCVCACVCVCFFKNVCTSTRECGKNSMLKENS